MIRFGRVPIVFLPLLLYSTFQAASQLHPPSISGFCCKLCVLEKGRKSMKTKLKLLCGALSLSLLFTACGGKQESPAQDPAGAVPENGPTVLGGDVTVTGGAGAEALNGVTLEPGTVLNATECAIMLTYIPETDDEGAAEEIVNGWGEANGYMPITQQGAGTHIYAVGRYDDKVSAVVLGEEESFRIGAEAEKQGQTRRFAQKNIIWNADGVSGWQVLVVDEQDYYEENGGQYPCYMIALLPVG